ncbi:hypothetical protein ACJX0J_009806, partial [Zea mays]
VQVLFQRNKRRLIMLDDTIQSTNLNCVEYLAVKMVEKELGLLDDEEEEPEAEREEEEDEDEIEDMIWNNNIWKNKSSHA